MRWCVFCGSAPGNDPRFAGYATAVGTALARAGNELVYGGGRTGLMGAVADAAAAFIQFLISLDSRKVWNACGFDEP